MAPYKLKVMNVEYDIVNLSPIRQKTNFYPREDNNCGDDSRMVLLGEGHLSDMVIPENTYLSSKTFM